MRLGVRYKIGVRGYRGGWSACDQYSHFVLRHVSLAALAQAELLGAVSLPEPRPQLYLTAAERARASGLWGAGAASSGTAPLRVLVGSAAGHSDKSWSREALGTALGEVVRASVGRPVDVVIVGSAADQAGAEAVIAASGTPGSIRSLAGQVTLRETFALTEQADVVLTNPSMLLHVAAAFRRPTVAVLGGTFADRDEHDIVWGYPAPYSSVAPLQLVPETPELNWPSVERVVEAVLLAAQCRPACEARPQEAHLPV
jgi:ADP-heptose:LPS heptosyltransferase